MAEIASISSDILWVYNSAEHRSSTLQRNQGLQLATADVVFLLDDDSLMYPTCAEEIMLPQARGLLVALKYSSKLFALPDKELAEWYPYFQQEFLVADRLID
jgi:glycosyltransferase involved in cell wall biosynthesis